MKTEKSQNKKILGGVIILLIGFVFLFKAIFPAFGLDYAFALIIIAIGIYTLLRTSKKEEITVKSGDLFMGGIIMTTGILFLLKTIGLINFSSWQILKVYWPVGLIIIGIAVMLRARWSGWFFVLIVLILLGIASTSIKEDGRYRQVTKEIPSNNSTKTIELNIDYGASTLWILDGTKDNLIKYSLDTTSIKEPIIDYKSEGSKAMIGIKKEIEFGPRLSDTARIEINPDMEINMKLDYGAVDAELDLRNLKVNNIEIDSGASKTKISFGNYPTKVKIDTGASAIEFNYPKEIGVRLKVDGLVGTELKEFTKEGDVYYSSNYDNKLNNIEIEMDAGASSIKGESY